MSKVAVPQDKVAVLMGGNSPEREIALLSGHAALAALQAQGVNAHAFDPQQRDWLALRSEGFTRAFNCLHGGAGEDGRVAGLLECLRIPYTGSGALAAALAMNKAMAKTLWRAEGIRTADWQVVSSAEQTLAALRTLDRGAGVALKPLHGGSSLGCSRLRRAEDCAAAIKEAQRYEPSAIAETFIEGIEVTSALTARQVFPLIRIEAPEGQYDYQNKYFTDLTRYECPCGLPQPWQSATEGAARAAYAALGCRGLARADFILDAQGQPWILEINTLPGLTGHSLAPKAAQAAGVSFATLCAQILAAAALDGGEAVGRA